MFASQTCITDHLMDEQPTLTFATVAARASRFIDTFDLKAQLDMAERIDAYLCVFDPSEWAERLNEWLQLDPEYERLASRLGWQ